MHIKINISIETLDAQLIRVLIFIYEYTLSNI